MPRGGGVALDGRAARSGDAHSQVHWLASKVRVLEGRIASLEARTGETILTAQQETKQWLKASAPDTSKHGQPELFQLFDGDECDASTHTDEESCEIDCIGEEALTLLVEGSVQGLLYSLEARKTVLLDLFDVSPFCARSGDEDLGVPGYWRIPRCSAPRLS